MKSPTSSVGIIEPEGILNGSTTKERRPNTIRITGKKLAPYSTHQGLGAPAGRSLRAWKRSKNHSTPVATRSRKRVRAKFMRFPSLAFVGAQHGEEGLLRNFHVAHLLHALLAFLLLLEQLLLARDVAAIALGEHVFAQRLDRLARDDVRTDRRLHRHIEHLARNQPAQLARQLAPAVLCA